jgi:hypothetical protein
VSLGVLIEKATRKVSFMRMSAPIRPVCLVAIALLAAHPCARAEEGAIPPEVRYDFSAGDTLAAKAGWSFENTKWNLASLPDGSGKGLPFIYPGVKPGNYGMSEMRFSMPPADQFWLSFRWHVPKNYAHRHDTHLDIGGIEAAGWQIGDKVRGADGTSEGVISQIDAKGVFLRLAAQSAMNQVWVGEVTNITRNSKRASTGRSQWGANNKLLAIWADGYSTKGLGSTIVWQTDLTEWSEGRRDSTITVGYSTGNHTVTGPPASGGVLIGPGDAGKYVDLIFHARFTSKPGAKDGVIQTWARKQGEAAYKPYHNITTAEIDKRTDVPAGEQPWHKGYLMGWANSGYDAETTFYISRLVWTGREPAERTQAPAANIPNASQH